MISLFNNLINGNLDDAKKQARKHTKLGITRYMEEMGYSSDKATKAAEYLKNPSNETYQIYCDAD